MNCNFVLVMTILVAGITLPVASTHPTDPDIGITFEQLVSSRGFQVETHQITTEDGYILTVQRIINPTVSDLTKLKPVVLQHGLLDTGMDFVISSPFLYSKQSSASNATTIDSDENDYLGDNLGLDLSLTRRYDVWVANSRGVMRTKNQHVNLSTSDPQFWAYSVDELGRFDLPAVIDFVLASTSRSSLGYIGFSQGTTSLFVLLSMKPEYADKVKPAITLAPEAFRSHRSSPLRYLNPEKTGLCLRNGQLFYSRHVFNTLLSRLCPIDFLGVICPNILSLFGGLDPAHLNKTRVPVYYSYVPAPGSNQIQCHNYQNYKSDRFARYDYGSDEKNMEHYGRTTPPDYPLEQVGNVTIAFFMGASDQFSDLVDLATLIEHLSNSQANLLSTFIVDDPDWGHINFVYGTNAGNLVYKNVIDILDRYSGD